MLEEWLGPTDLSTFRAAFLQRAALAHPSTVSGARTLLDWDLLDAVLAADPPADVLVVAEGRLLPVRVPRGAGELLDYLRVGIGVCIRHSERVHPRLRSIADAFERDLGEAQVQLFVTPPGSYGFSWHYDDEDVFIAQTAGIKDYFFRANTVAADERAHASVFSRLHRESSVLQAATLLPGDFLYIPARWWHMARCHETSLSISVGVTPARRSLPPDA